MLNLKQSILRPLCCKLLALRMGGGETTGRRALSLLKGSATKLPAQTDCIMDLHGSISRPMVS